MATRSAATKLDWAKVSSSLSLRGQTATSLQAFKKRNDDARRKVQALSEAPVGVDFAHYRSVLSNKAVVDKIEAQFKAYKPASFDLGRQLKAIEAFEAQALKGAEETKTNVVSELKKLEETLAKIETARPLQELTVEEVNAAEPEVLKKTEQLVSQGRWMPPGYQEKFGNLALM
ncbi:GAL4 enhancer protein [Ascosphaera pollenicola]|nr:GAL4 enhancer protein [Ascosphaera pollenicola]